MANTVYPKFKEALLNKLHDLDTDDIRVLLMKSTQAYSAAHEFVSDLTGASIVARSTNVGSKTIALGVFNFAAVTYTTPPSDTYIFIVYAYNASDAAARLIAYIDTGTNIPATTTGGDVTFQTDGVKLFALYGVR